MKSAKRSLLYILYNIYNKNIIYQSKLFWEGHDVWAPYKTEFLNTEYTNCTLSWQRAFSRAYFGELLDFASRMSYLCNVKQKGTTRALTADFTRELPQLHTRNLINSKFKINKFKIKATPSFNSKLINSKFKIKATP